MIRPKFQKQKGAHSSRFGSKQLQFKLQKQKSLFSSSKKTVYVCSIRLKLLEGSRCAAQTSEGSNAHAAPVSKVQSVDSSSSWRNKIILLKFQKNGTYVYIYIAQASNVTNCSSPWFFKSKKAYIQKEKVVIWLKFQKTAIYITRISEGKTIQLKQSGKHNYDGTSPFNPNHSGRRMNQPGHLCRDSLAIPRMCAWIVHSM